MMGRPSTTRRLLSRPPKRRACPPARIAAAIGGSDRAHRSTEAESSTQVAVPYGCCLDRGPAAGQALDRMRTSHVMRSPRCGVVPSWRTAPGRGRRRRRPRVLVLPFAAQATARRPGGAGPALWLGEAARAARRESRPPRRRGVPRDQRVAAFDRLQLPMSVRSDAATMIRIGELVGASEVVFGEVRLGRHALRCGRASIACSRPAAAGRDRRARARRYLRALRARGGDGGQALGRRAVAAPSRAAGAAAARRVRELRQGTGRGTPAGAAALSRERR